MITEECAGRLINFKFRDAVAELTEEATEREREVVTALSIFGNPGWFLGGAMETILNAAIQSVLPESWSPNRQL